MMSKETENFDDFEMCGEIVTTFKDDKRIFALTCAYCSKSFKTLNDYANHFNVMHSEESAQNHIQISSESSESISGLIQEDESMDIHNVDTSSDVKVESTTITDPNLYRSKEYNECNDFDPMSLVNTTFNESVHDLMYPAGLHDFSEVKEHSDKDVDYDSDNSDYSSDDGGSSTKVTKSKSSKKSGKPYVSVSSFFDLETEKDLVFKIIAALKDFPVLLNITKGALNSRVRADAIKNFTSCFNKAIGTKHASSHLDKIIKTLIRRYHIELEEEKISKLEGNKFSPSRFFQKIHELHMDFKPHERITLENKKSFEYRRKYLPIPYLTKSQNEKFILIYKSFRCLWDRENLIFHLDDIHKRALNVFVKNINVKLILDLTPKKVFHGINIIHNTATYEKFLQVQCERKGLEYKPVSDYFKHISFLLEHVFPFKCCYCHETFKSFEVYKRHESEHDKSKAFTCPKCEYSVMKLINLKRHFRDHIKTWSYLCENCFDGFSTQDELALHKKTHLMTFEEPATVNAKNNNVVQVPQVSKTQQSNNQKKRTANKEITKPNGDESTISKKMKSQMDQLEKNKNEVVKTDRLTKLIHDSSEDDEENIDVQIGQKRASIDLNKTTNTNFIWPNFRRKAKKLTKDEGLCNICGLELLYQTNLEKHVRRHFKEKEIEVCGDCGQRFESHTELTSHLKEHKNTITRTSRSKTFNVNTSLSKDCTTYICTVCGQGSLKDDDFVSHMRTHPRMNTNSNKPQGSTSVKN